MDNTRHLNNCKGSISSEISNHILHKLPLLGTLYVVPVFIILTIVILFQAQFGYIAITNAFVFDCVLVASMCLLCCWLYLYFQACRGSLGIVEQVRGYYVDWRMLRDVKRRQMAYEYADTRLRINAIRKNTLLPKELQVPIWFNCRFFHLLSSIPVWNEVNITRFIFWPHQ